MRLPGLRIFTSEGFEARYSRPWLLFTIPTIFGMTAIAIVAASMCLLGIIFAVILGVGVSAYRYFCTLCGRECLLRVVGSTLLALER